MNSIQSNVLWDGAPCYSKLVIDWSWVDPKDGFNIGIKLNQIKDPVKSALPTPIY